MYTLHKENLVLDILEYVLCLRIYIFKRVVYLSISVLHPMYIVYICVRLISLRTIESFIYISIKNTYNKAWCAISCQW